MARVGRPGWGAVLVGLLPLVGACGDRLYVVSERRTDDDGAVNGVPFYPVEAFVRTAAAYEERWTELRFEAVVTRPAPLSPERRSAVRFVRDPACAAKLVSAVQTAEDGAAGAYERLAPTLFADPPAAYRGCEPAAFALVEPPVLARAQVKEGAPGLAVVRVERARVQRPAMRPLYLNVQKPPFASVSGELELGPDGTLSRSTAEVTDEALTTVLGALPVGDLVSAALTGVGLGAPESGGTGGVRTARVTELHVTAIPVARRYVVTLETPAADAAPTALPGGGDAGASFAVALSRGDAAGAGEGGEGASGDAGGDDAPGRVLRLRGELTLPDAAAPGAAE